MTTKPIARWALIAALGAAPFAASADENGVMQQQSYACAENPVTSILAVCEAVKQVLPFIECPKTTGQCVRARQEIFTGLTGEVATPTNIKPWNGQGVSGEIFQSVGLCLLRDLNAAPMQAHAEANLPIGKISVDGLVDYMAFDPKAKTFAGSHRMTGHAPVIGDVDLMTQVFSAKAVNSDVKGMGFKVGEYAVYGAHALDFEADGGAESFSFELDAITIVTPYGTVSPKPHLTLGRGSFWSLSPYGGATGMTLNPGGFQTTDVYGRLKGRQIASALKVNEWKQGKPPGGGPGIVGRPRPLCQNFAAQQLCLWPTPTGWDSQVMLGARNVDPRPPAAAWTAPPGVAFPDRPDALIDKARGGGEKLPNGYADAGIKIEYSPIGMLPEGILSNGFIKPTFKVWADPNIKVGYASQFNFWNAQAATWNPYLYPGAPAVPGTPVDVESLHSTALYGGVSVAGRFAVDAGVDLVLKVHIPLPWPLDDIEFNIVDAHPRAAFLEQTDADTKPASRKAFVHHNAKQFVKTGQPFAPYSPLTGGNVDGFKHLQACFAEPPPPAREPDKPKYNPGDPEDLLEFVDMPCNVCVGHADFIYLEVKTPSPFTYEVKTMKGVAEKVPFVDDSALPASDKWVCGGPLGSGSRMTELPPVPALDLSKVKSVGDANAYNKASAAAAKNAFKNAGCYDQCRLNKTTGKFDLVASARKLYALGVIKDAPNGCY